MWNKLSLHSNCLINWREHKHWDSKNILETSDLSYSGTVGGKLNSLIRGSPKIEEEEEENGSKEEEEAL